MTRPRLICKPSHETTRLYLTFGNRELLRAALPTPGAAHPRAAPTLLEGLSLWLQRPLSVVLCADAEETSCELGLCDGLGFGRQTAYSAELDHHDRRIVITPIGHPDRSEATLAVQ